MVQESTNIFSDGLIKDLNPLTTPNSVLTDALNATLITFNGNELVLQNDMGNAKITGAKLTDGYNPIGVKENEGILYIVSLNSEGRVEIGSFPSPEIREIEETLNIIQEISVNSIGTGLNKNYILSDIELNPGDNFLIAFKSNDFSSISNYNERNFYKFKLLSINNGIEIDITDTLIHQEKYNTLTQTFKDSGYWFVPLNNGELIDLSLYKLNNKLQTYKNKKKGKLVLRIELESIDEFRIDNNDGTYYPILILDNFTRKLQFNLYSEFLSKIKPNKITLSGTIFNKETNLTENIIPINYSFIPTTTLTNTIELSLASASLKQIVDYKIEIENTDTEIKFDKFIIQDKIDLSNYLFNNFKSGNLYNGYTINYADDNSLKFIQNSAWRIPSDSDFINLQTIASQNPMLFITGNQWDNIGTNISNFSALPSQYITHYGVIKLEPKTVRYWTNIFISDKRFAARLDIDNVDLIINHYNNYRGYSIRLCSDTPIECKDYNNNIYNYVKIGDLYWMIEDFKGTYYSNGTPIPFIEDLTLWENAINGGYQLSPNI